MAARRHVGPSRFRGRGQHARCRDGHGDRRLGHHSCHGHLSASTAGDLIGYGDDVADQAVGLGDVANSWPAPSTSPWTSLAMAIVVRNTSSVMLRHKHRVVGTCPHATADLLIVTVSIFDLGADGTARSPA